ATKLLDRAEAAVDVPLRHLVTDPDADLRSTRDAQLSVLLGSLIVWEAIRPILDTADLQPVAHAGHSLGQIPALLPTAAVALAIGLRLAIDGADASARAQQADPGALLALLGANEQQARAVCHATGDRAWIANLNGGGQIIVGTRPADLDDLARIAKESGVRRTQIGRAHV